LADSPLLLIVGGPNGSGKTTVAKQLSESRGIPYLGADAIAEQLNPSNPANAAITASRTFSRTIRQLIAKRQSFICESTLSGLTLKNFLGTARTSGYKTEIVYLFVESEDMCLTRIAERVRKGGHDVPEVDVRRRFSRSLHNFWNVYRHLADSWVVCYNGFGLLHEVAVGTHAEPSIRDPKLYSRFQSLIGEFSCPAPD
jgi:predicted ABC-type ATPase